MVQGLAEAGIDEHAGELVAMFGLIALGLPLSQIENLTGRKSETIKRRLRRCRARGDLWNQVMNALLEHQAFGDSDPEVLEVFGAGTKNRNSPFVRAFSKRLTNVQVGSALFELRESLRERIEHFVGAEIAYTGSGDFFRADVDVERIPWIKEIRRSVGRVEDCPVFGEYEVLVWDQVRCPNAQARALAERRVPPVMTLRCLCKGMGENMSLGGFMDNLKSIVAAIDNGWV